MDIVPFNFIRPKEEIPQHRISDTTLQDLTNRNLLSSPISSYNIEVNPEDPSELHVTHPQPYPLRTKFLKGQVEALRDEIHDVHISYAETRHELAQLTNKFEQNRQEQKAEKEKLVDWETRTRIAQGLNDQWVPLVTMDYNLLKDNGITHLPHILSVWAVKEGRDPAPSFLNKIHLQEVDRMIRRAESFESKGLHGVVEHIWDSITVSDRNTMIAMYLSTRSHPCTSVAHPLLTGDEGRRVIEADSGLSIEEKEVAYAIIETAIDKEGNLLFFNF